MNSNVPHVRLWTHQNSEWDITTQKRKLDKVDQYLIKAYDVIHKWLKTRQLIFCMSDSAREKCPLTRSWQLPESHDRFYEWELDVPRSAIRAALRRSILDEIHKEDFLRVSNFGKPYLIPQFLIDKLFLADAEFEENNNGYDYLITAPLANSNWVKSKTEFWLPKPERAVAVL